jgi:hypothetical protein
MDKMSHNSDTFWGLYGIGGADLALRYAEMSSEARECRSAAEPQRKRNLTILDLRFFAGDKRFSEEAAQQIGSIFPLSSTKYLWFMVDLRNPWQYISCEYKLTARYHWPDGGTYERVHEFEIPAKCPTFRRSGALGWDMPGKWSPGRYRVEVLVDGQQRSGEFIITDDHPKSSATNPFADPGATLNLDEFTRFRSGATTPRKVLPWLGFDTRR